MRCPNCQTINPSYAKFCMECGNRLLVCANCQTVNFPTAKFCIECGSSLLEQTRVDRSTLPLAEVEPVLNPVPVASVVKWPVEPSRAVTQQLTEPEERRIVTIMFADITGSTPLADRLDPEDMRAILVGYFNRMNEQIRRHGGTVEKYIGDAVMAVFGSPVAHEDDPDRAIRAALDMQTALNNFNAMRQVRDPEAALLQMRIGINTGEVAAPGAQFNRQDFLITGDAVNVAARLQQVAAPDTILVGERTYLIAREVFEFRALAPLQVKGKAEALRAWSVVGFRSRDLAIIQHPRGIVGLEAPLVGRSLELALIHATYARVRDARHSHLVTLLGSPGVGKSRLAREFIENELEAAHRIASGQASIEPRVLRGRCPPYGEGITYWPLVEILRSLIQINEGESDEELEQRFSTLVRETLRKAGRSENVDQVTNVLFQRVGSGLSGDIGRTARRKIQRSKANKGVDKNDPEATLQRACRVLLEAMAQVQPLILVIDDMQWADEALLRLLEYLAGHITDFPLLFVCLARQDFLERRRDWGGGQPNFTTIILDALNSEETAELISELLATHDLPDVVVHTIQRRAEGNPFFVEEIVRMLIDQGVLVEEDSTWQISEQSESALSDLASPATPPEDTLIDQHYVLPLPRLPDTIQGVLAARIDLLSPIEKQVLQAASIVGRTFWISAILELAENLDREVVQNVLELLARRDFIEESEKKAPGPIVDEQSFNFKHVLTRDVVYQNIPRTRRSQKHAQLALWLETRVADRLENFAELLAYHYQQALLYWSAARQAQTLSPEDSGLGNDDRRGANQLFALTHTDLIERTIRYVTLAGDQAYHGYYTIRAIQAYTEALDLLRENEADALTLAQMHQKLGCAYTQRSNVDEAWNEFIRALELVRTQPEVAPKELMHIYIQLAELATRCLGWFNTWLDMQEVRFYINEGLKLLADQPPSHEQSSFLTFQAIWYMLHIKYDVVSSEQRPAFAESALQSALEARRIAEAINDPVALWLALDALGFVYDKQHKYTEEHIVLHERQKLQNMIQWREELYDLYISLGWGHERIGDYAVALNWLGQAWQVALTMESPSMLLSSMRARLIVWYRWNRWDEAREAANSLLQTSEQYQRDEDWSLIALSVLTELAYREGNEEESNRLFQLYQERYQQYPGRHQHLSSIYMARREWSLALADLRSWVSRNELFPSPESLAQMAELVVLAGEPVEEQETVCERAVSVSTEAGASKFLAVALRARGRMYLTQENWDAAECNFRQALEGFQALDLPWEQGETFACLGQFYRQRNCQSVNGRTGQTADLELARLFFERALGFFESLHAVHDAQRIRQELAEDAQPAV